MSDKKHIQSSLLDQKSMRFVKHSLRAVSELDDNELFRVNLLEYIDYITDKEDDQFFWEMMPFIRFCNPESEEIAFTVPDKRIFLNCPCKDIGKNKKQWEFAYDHECLHQLWETFKVEDEIEKKEGTVKRDVMNIASDCVINDYLYRIRGKVMPEFGLITPEYIKSEYNVEYNPKEDTQYTLYMKLKDIPMKKLNPKVIHKAPPPPPMPGMPQPKYSDEYKKGWSDGIADVIHDRVDPLKYTPKQEKNDYDRGYNDVMAKMKDGLENGITMPDKPNDTPQTGNDGLRQIPWNTPPEKKNDKNKGGQGQSSGSSDQKDQNQDQNQSQQSDSQKAQSYANNAKENAKNAQEAADKAKANGDPDAQQKQDAANKAKDAANKAQQHADAAKDAESKGDSSKAKSEADAADQSAQDAAKANSQAGGKPTGSSQSGSGNKSDSQRADDAAHKAKEAANNAQDAADKAKKNGDSDAQQKQDAADKAKAAADEAQKQADAAKDAESKGDSGKAKDAADKAEKKAKEAAEENKKAGGKELSGESENKNDLPPEAGTSPYVDLIETPADIEQITKDAEIIIKKYQHKITGDLADFLKKCKASFQRKPEGVRVAVRRGNTTWNQELFTIIHRYLRSKTNIFRYQDTFSRVRRGSGFVKMGEPIKPGIKKRPQALIIDTAFYIDVSGSMHGSSEAVFKAAYQIAESINKSYKKHKSVEKIDFKMFAFNDYLHKLTWGSTADPNGGTMSFSSVLGHIKKNTKNYLINVIITDAGFGGQHEADELKKALKEIDGIVFFIANTDAAKIKDLANDKNNNLYYIQADRNFTVKDNDMRQISGL